jgi:hypothetical protein
VDDRRDAATLAGPSAILDGDYRDIELISVPKQRQVELAANPRIVPKLDVVRLTPMAVASGKDPRISLATLGRCVLVRVEHNRAIPETVFQLSKTVVSHFERRFTAAIQRTRLANILADRVECVGKRLKPRFHA